MQASPSDPENFPFVVLGNKVDLDEGRSRVVRLSMHACGDVHAVGCACWLRLMQPRCTRRMQGLGAGCGHMRRVAYSLGRTGTLVGMNSCLRGRCSGTGLARELTAGGQESYTTETC